MLKRITYTFPKDTSDSRNFFKQLATLLAELPNAQMQDGKSITITPSKPVGALPVTAFVQSDIPFPQVSLGNSPELSLSVGNLHINLDSASDVAIDKQGFEQIHTKHDPLGTYVELQAGTSTIYRLPIHELAKRLKNHIVRIDHTGINIPAELVPHETWQQFIHTVAQQANLYHYPTTAIWPFILPATSEEHAADITQFPVGREPKLELVYDTYSPAPTIQIDIQSNLTRQEVEQLFPEPYGISFPDLADFFRTVYVHHEWPGLAIRFDIRFKGEQSSEWATGKWLVEEGGRIRPKIPELIEPTDPLLARKK